MDGLNLLTAAGQTIVLRGTRYRLGPLTLADFGEIENRILANRPKVATAELESLAGQSEPQQRDALERLFNRAAAARRVALADLDRWWRTSDGFCYRLWLMLRKRHAIELDQTAALLKALTRAERRELWRTMETCCGLPAWDPTVESDPAAVDLDASLPWSRWAWQLSRRYGWTPQTVARLTVAQVWLYLSEPAFAGRRRMSHADGVALCTRRSRQREAWIERMLEKLRATRTVATSG